MLSEFASKVKDVAGDVVNEIHTAIPGTIQAVDLNTGFVTVAPVGKYKTRQGKYLDFPVLSSVPLVLPQSSISGVEIAFPVAVGDSCLLIFSEQQLDSFLYGGESKMTLRFDLTNAVAIPGLGKVAGSAFQEACSSKSVVIRSGATKLTVSNGNVSVQGSLSVSGNINCSGTIYGTIPGL